MVTVSESASMPNSENVSRQLTEVLVDLVHIHLTHSTAEYL